MTGAMPMTERRDANNLLTPAQATELLAHRAMEKGEDLADVKGRWRKRIEKAQKDGDLEKIGGKYRCVDLADWARGRKQSLPSDWLSRLADLPFPPPSGKAKIEIHATGEGLVIPALPQTLEEAHARIIHLHTEIESKEREIERLRPDAERYRASCAKKADGARQPRK